MITASREKQTVFIAENWDECSNHMYDLMAEDYVVTNLVHRDPYYCVVMDKGTAWQRQDILFAADFPRLEINDYWDKGLDITYITADDLTWMIYFCAGSGISGQEWYFKKSFEEIRGAINSLWKQNKVITDLKKSYGGIVVVMSGGVKWNQMWTMNREFPEAIMRKEGKENKRAITLLTDIDGHYFMVMSAGTEITFQDIYMAKTLNKVEKRLEERWDEGLYVTSAAFVRDELLLVFSK